MHCFWYDSAQSVVFTVFPLPEERFWWYLLCSRSLEKDFVCILRASRSVERDFDAIYGVHTPWREIVLLFTVFPVLGGRFCRYLRCARFLERDFACIYGVPAPLRKILSVFTVFPLPGKRFPGERFY